MEKGKANTGTESRSTGALSPTGLRGVRADSTSCLRIYSADSRSQSTPTSPIAHPTDREQGSSIRVEEEDKRLKKRKRSSAARRERQERRNISAFSRRLSLHLARRLFVAAAVAVLHSFVPLGLFKRGQTGNTDGRGSSILARASENAYADLIGHKALVYQSSVADLRVRRQNMRQTTKRRSCVPTGARGSLACCLNGPSCAEERRFSSSNRGICVRIPMGKSLALS